MRFFIFTIGFLLLASGNAQNLTNPSWTSAAGGSADSRIKKITQFDDGSVITMGSFRRGDISFGSLSLTENPLLDNHFIVKLNAQGQTEWLKGDFTTTYDILTDINGDVVVPSGDTLYKLSGIDGSLIWKVNVEPVNGTYLRIYQVEELSGGEILIAGEGYSEDINSNGFSLDRSTAGHYLFTAKCDGNGIFNRITAIDFNNMPMLNEMYLRKGSDNGYYLSFKADELANNTLYYNVNVENPLPTNPSRTALVAYNEYGNATWAMTFKGDSANALIKEIQFNENNGELLVSGNSYGAYGNYAPFTVNTSSSVIESTCSGTSFQAFSLVIDTVSKTVVSQYENAFGCQGSSLNLGFRNYNNNRYSLIQYQQNLTINSNNLVANTDTSADQQLFFSTALVKYDINGNILSATETENKFGNSFGDLHISTNGDVITAGLYVDHLAIDGSIPHAIISKYANTTTMITELTNLPQVNVYPNPSSGDFSLETSEAILSVEIYSTDGRMILANVGESNLMHLDLSSQPAGIYLVKTRTISSILKRLIVVEK